MADELNEQVVDAGTGAAPTAEPAAGASTEAATSGEATTEAGKAPEDTKAQIEAAVQEAVGKYEGKDGHLARLRSSKDKEIAALKKQLRQRQESNVEQAKALIESGDTQQAAQILLSQAEEQAQRIAQEGASHELLEWRDRVLADLGVDLEGDEDAAQFAQEWGERLLDDPQMTYDYQQAAAQFQLKRERDENKATKKRLADLEGGMEEAISAAVTRALVGQGIIPDPTPEGGQPSGNEDWRKNPSISRGLKKRKENPVARR